MGKATAKWRIGLIGVGARGMSHLSGILTERDDVLITRIADLAESRAADAAGLVQEKMGNTPAITTEWRRIIEADDVDCVVIASDWDNHVPATCAALRAGKKTACECGGAYTLDECWELVRAYEDTGNHVMFLENCCYDRNELMVTRMVRAGLFGEVVHCEGGYQHDLRDMILQGYPTNQFRVASFMHRCCEYYPTHDLGPIAKLLDINRGNRMVSLVSMASSARGLNDYAKRHPDTIDPAMQDYRFCQGDVVQTMIRCAHGQTITLTVDTSLPRFYSRNFTVQGTRGFFAEREQTVFLDGDSHSRNDYLNNLDKYRPEWEHPIWKRFHEARENNADNAKLHGGMDWILFDAWFSSLEEGKVPPIDTYDMASWMAITPLSEVSIRNGSSAVEIPDFTRGAWIDRQDDRYAGEWALDR